MSKAAAGTDLHPCPNPKCRKRIFVSASNLNKHFGHKPECLAYAKSLLHTHIKQSLQNAMQDEIVMDETQVIGNQQETKEVDDDDFQMADTTFPLDDYENSGFDNDDGDELDLPGYQTTYTVDKKVEVTLLKICTELEAPLYAFETIMKWRMMPMLWATNFVQGKATTGLKLIIWKPGWEWRISGQKKLA